MERDEVTIGFHGTRKKIAISCCVEVKMFPTGSVRGVFQPDNQSVNIR